MNFIDLLTLTHSIQLPSFNFLLTTTAPEADPSIVLAGVLLSAVTIYFAAKIGGEICAALDFPSVLGELLGGVIVGVSALHLLVFPGVGIEASDSLIMQFLQMTSDLHPENIVATFHLQSEVISLLAEIGVIVLLFEIGLESNLKELMEVGTQALIVAVVGVIAPFAAGTAGLMIIFGVPAIPAIFAGAALTATSIGITSRVLSEMGQLVSKEGQIILGAAVIDDVLGVIVLAVAASLAKTGEVDVANVIYLIVSASGFLIGAILLGNAFNQSFVKVVNILKTRGGIVVPAFTFAFAMAYLATTIHLEAILGAFAAGLVLDETDKRKELQRLVEPVSDMLVPIFFIAVGAKTDLSVLNPVNPDNREGLIIAAFLVTVAIVGKVLAGFIIFGRPDLNKLAIGVGMIPRGEVGLVFVAVGATSGVLSSSLEAAIVVMVILTTFIAPALLRVVFKSQESKDKSPQEIASVVEPTPEL